MNAPPSIFWWQRKMRPGMHHLPCPTYLVWFRERKPTCYRACVLCSVGDAAQWEPWNLG